MEKARLMPLKLPPASSFNNNHVTHGQGRSFLRQLGLGCGLLAVMVLLYVPAYYSARGHVQGLSEIPRPTSSPLGGSQTKGSVARIEFENTKSRGRRILVDPKPVVVAEEPQLPDWSSNTTRDVRVYVRPEINTTIISPIGICTSPPFLIVIVGSSVGNKKERQALRDTWANKSILKNVYNTTVEVVFLLGERHDKSSTEVLEHENSQHGDIIQEKFYDTYNNLTLKSVMILKWAVSNCGQAKFVMKTDDDMFVNIPVLVKLLQAESQPNRVLVGRLFRNTKPIVNPKSKWYVPKYLYSEAKYPDYLVGTGYVMSSDVVFKLYNTALDTPLLHIEDVFLTGICAKRATLLPTDHPAFNFVPDKLDPCIFRNVITAHKMSTSKLHQIWNKMKNSTSVCANSSPKIQGYRP